MKKIFTSLVVMAAPVLALAQWSPASYQGKSQHDAGNVKSYYKLDLNKIQSHLRGASLVGKGEKGVEIELPTLDGKVERFQVYSFPVVVKSLADKYQLESYTGIGIDDPEKRVRFSVAPNDFQSMIMKDGHYEFIEPVDKENSIYGVHPKTNKVESRLGFVCSTEESPIDKKTLDKLLQSGSAFPYNNNLTTRMSDQKYRTMRLAMSVTGEYTAYFGGVPQALAQVNATLTRVNGVYEKELALHLDLQDFPQLIYADASTDPYSTAANMTNWNLELQKTLTSVVGEANYDIGHLFGATGGGGNAGCIGCVCVSPSLDTNGVATSNAKGSGITSPADGKPYGDNFDIDYVAHEMGHQLGGNHTFSHKLEGAGVNVEPGSGTTIMAYAGITGASTDVQAHSDPYFHTLSIKQIQTNLIAKTCDVETPVTNLPPVITDMPDISIPKGTAFYLTAQAIDTENDALTYSWEEIDNAGVVVNKTNLGATTTGPSFRVLNPTSSPTRYFPKFSSVMAGILDNSSNTWESVSKVARTTNFQILVRDNNSTVQQTQTANQKVVVGADGPFAITSNKVYNDVASSAINWNVVNTDKAPYNSPNVKIDYTLDNGTTWTTLADSTPNDGTEAFNFQNIPTGNIVKVRISAIGNVFYTVASLTATKYPTATPDCPTLLLPANAATNISYRNSVVLSWSAPTTGDLPDSYDVYFDQNPNPTTLVGNTAATTFTVVAPIPATTYYWKVVPKNLVGSSTACTVFSFVTADPSYCTAGATSTNSAYEKISTVKLANIANSSTSAAGYEDFTSVVGNLTVGQTYPFTADFSGSSYSTDQVMVWIDFNNDKDFDDAGELVLTKKGKSPWTGNIIIPANLAGVTTRMRVRLTDTSTGSNVTPCGTSTYGQVEDYTVVISPATLAVQDISKSSLAIYPNPVTDVLNIPSADNKANFKIYDLSGRLVKSGNITNQKINVSELPKGNYIISVDSKGNNKTEEFIKQ